MMCFSPTLWEVWVKNIRYEVGGQSLFFCQLYYPQQTERWALHRGRWFHQQQQKAFFELVFLGYAYLFFRQTIDMGKVGPQGDATLKDIFMLLHFLFFLHYVIHERLLLEDKYIWSISKLLYNLDCSLLSLSPSFLHIHFYRGHVRNVIQITKAHNLLMLPDE